MIMLQIFVFCYLFLFWQREVIIFLDFLRFVEEDYIFYINVFQYFLEQMKLYGCDRGIFGIEFWFDYEDIYKKIIEVGIFLDLFCFLDIIEDCYFYFNILCMKYLMEVNFFDEMYSLICYVVKMIGMGEVDFLIFDFIVKMVKIVKYDV